jgi:pimeloyl-ACP methyl ester carboxylesterase
MMVEKVAYEEFSYFHENAQEYGIPFKPPTVRREFVEVEPGRRLSVLIWGTTEPELVFLHGGAQNAHTWDTVGLALDVSMICIDLPGHGHSDGPSSTRAHGPTDLFGNAEDVAVVIRKLAPNTKAVIGMSLGGMTTIALMHVAPELVRKAVLVDVTPGVNQEKAKAITNFINGPRTFPSFEELLARTIEHNPTRTEASLRRGILHNAIQQEDGSWVWRYRLHGDASVGEKVADEKPMEGFASMWDVLAQATMPILLVRGMRPQSVMDDADEEMFLETVADPTVVRVAEAGHSVQGDTPVELAEMIREFIF